MTWDSTWPPEHQQRAVCATKQRHVRRLYTALLMAGYQAKIVNDGTYGQAIELLLPDASDSFLFIECKAVGRRWRFIGSSYLPVLGTADDIDATVERLRRLIGSPRSEPSDHPERRKKGA
ncbi:hypothetical protein [Flindersiella endophytica]